MSSTTQTTDLTRLSDLSALLRRWILTCTTRAGSGHPTSSLSAVELMVDLYFGGQLQFDVDDPGHPNNDRVIFSKGHASPLLYSLWAAAGQVAAEELMTYREFDSPLEGHPTSRFRFAEAATGSLGQGLSIGVGTALAAKYLDRLPHRTYVLLGDSEMTEGSQWEALQIAAQYRLNHLVGILDVNRLGQRGETMYGHDLVSYQRRIDAFGWRSVLVEDGHDHEQILQAYEAIDETDQRPLMIIARTLKGAGFSALADQTGWHGKPMDEDQLDAALSELGEVDESVRGTIRKPSDERPESVQPGRAEPARYEPGDQVATRDAYGRALRRLGAAHPRIVALDGEVCNSTRSKFFRDEFPDRFFEMFVAEQNMVGAAIGLSLRGRQPFVSTFAAFLTRAFDQIRMSRHSDADIKFAGSHAGVSIGEDGPSQMGLEDIAMFRAVLDSVVLYPSDAVSAERLVEAMIGHQGISYLRTTRGKTPVIYSPDESFEIGGSKVLRRSDGDRGTIIAAGITLHEALEASGRLHDQGIDVRVIDLYSVKPLDTETLRAAAESTDWLMTVEDHYPEGGMGEAVRTAVDGTGVTVRQLAVTHRPRSGTPRQLLDDQGISADAIVDEAKRLCGEPSAARPAAART